MAPCFPGRHGKQVSRCCIVFFFFLFSFFLLLIGLEEISWGQQLLKFETPATWLQYNSQGETNLHNLPGLQGRSEYMRLAFGVLGLLGIWLGKLRPLRPISTPPVLFAWFLLISLHAGIDTFNDAHPIQKDFDFYVQRTSELIECLIGIAAFLYLWLHVRARSCLTPPQD
jgi:hypothetical protein